MSSSSLGCDFVTSLLTRADQNTGRALLKSPMRTAMHEKSLVSSVISVELNCLQYLFAIINKISDSFSVCGGSPVG